MAEKKPLKLHTGKGRVALARAAAGKVTLRRKTRPTLAEVARGNKAYRP